MSPGRGRELRVRYPRPPLAVRFLRRPNRYRAEVVPLAGGEPFSAHVPNPGRMLELLLPGETEGYAIPAADPLRRTRADLVSVRHRGTLVSIDSRMANRVVRSALGTGLLRSFGPGPWSPEPRLGHHRLDFARWNPDGTPANLLEVKSSNLVLGRTAMFPDAPTVRGTAHVELLRQARRRGVRAGLLVVVQRNDVDEFVPNASMDPTFAATLEAASDEGVLVEARTVKVSKWGVVWGRRIPVRWPASGERF